MWSPNLSRWRNIIVSGPSNSFIKFYMPSVRFSSLQTNDSDRAIIRSLQFTALENQGTNVYAPLNALVVHDTGALALSY